MAGGRDGNAAGSRRRRGNRGKAPASSSSRRRSDSESGSESPPRRKGRKEGLTVRIAETSDDDDVGSSDDEYAEERAMAIADEFFETFDKEGLGYLTVGQLQDVLSKVGLAPLSREEVNHLLDQANIDSRDYEAEVDRGQLAKLIKPYFGDPFRGAVDPKRLHKVKKVGHRRVVDGHTVFKRHAADALKLNLQLGIRHSISKISGVRLRDLVKSDFKREDDISFPSEGSTTTPPHSSTNFVFRDYAPMAFRMFRLFYKIRPEDYLMSLCGKESLREIPNAGRSGALMFVSHDDQYIVKTVSREECQFLKRLLQSYYMNMKQNQNTLLPKFFGMHRVRTALGRNIRVVVMHNILPSSVQIHEKYDMKGSTFERLASEKEKKKRYPTLKDLDFVDLHPKGIMLTPETHKALARCLKRDCLVLADEMIMDYSLLLGIHYIDGPNKPRDSTTSAPRSSTSPRKSLVPSLRNKSLLLDEGSSAKLQQQLEHIEEIEEDDSSSDDGSENSVSQYRARFDEDEYDLGDERNDLGGIEGWTAEGDRVILFFGIIDILQKWRLKKKIERGFKSLRTDKKTVSVAHPNFYAERFRRFMLNSFPQKKAKRNKSNSRR